MEKLGVTYSALNNTAAVCFLFLGLGCLFLQPTALKLGRRFVYLLCTVLGIVSNICGSQANSIGLLYVLNLIGGFAAAPVDSLVEISTTDVFFQHERAQYLSFFIFALYAGSDLGPVAAGYIIENMSWRWCLYFQVIILGVMLVVQIFYMEDTTFSRIGTDSFNLEENILCQIKSHETIASKKGNGLDPVADDKNEAVVTEGGAYGADSEDGQSIDLGIPKRTYWQRMRLIETEYSDPRSWLTIWYRPFFLVSFPAIVWGGLVYGSQMMWLSLIQTTLSELYTAAPYHMSTQEVGLTNLSAFIGSIFGMFYGGNFVDWLTIKLSERNNGVLEPEFRLWAMIVPTTFNACGILAYGLGTSYAAHWFVSVGIGMFLMGFAMASTGGICLTYVVDCYPEVASEGLVLMLFIRNMIGMGFTFAIQPWLNRDGVKLTTWLMFMLSLVINGSFVLLLKWGKDCRRWTKERYYRYSDPMFGELFKK